MVEEANREWGPTGAELGANLISRERQIELHRTMCRIREAEVRLSELFRNNEVPGFIHLSIGQEAVAAGVVGALGASDTLATTHRGHGHVLARGVDLHVFFKEVMGRAGGICGGRSGSMHVADLSLGLLGANGIVGGGIPLAAGSALAHKIKRTSGVALVFFGDGAMAEGALYECLNIAALWSLPMFFVCENNGWSEFSPTAQQFAGKLDILASTFGLVHRRIDGNDVVSVASAADEMLAAARGGAAQILECITTRVHGHFEGDPQAYRSAEELAGLVDLDPITRSASGLRSLGLTNQEIDAINQSECISVANAIEAARCDALPDFSAALADVYTPMQPV